MCIKQISDFRFQIFRLLSIVSVVLFITCVSINKVSAQRFRGGMLAGLSTSQISGDNLGGFHQFGGMLGGLAALDFTENFAFQVELMFIQKGSSTTSKDSLRQYNLRLNYLEMPLMFTYKVKKLYVEGGPYVGFLLSSSEEDAYGEIPNQDPFKRLDAGLNLGFSFPLSDNLLLNARFSNSLIDVRPFYSRASYYFVSGQQNSVLAFSLRYYFKTNTQQ